MIVIFFEVESCHQDFHPDKEENVLINFIFIENFDRFLWSTQILLKTKAIELFVFSSYFLSVMFFVEQLILFFVEAQLYPYAWVLPYFFWLKLACYQFFWFVFSPKSWKQFFMFLLDAWFLCLLALYSFKFKSRITV